MKRDSQDSFVSVIILNYNAGDLLTDCVESLFNIIHKNFEVIVVDNASRDDSHKKCKDRFPKIRLIENKENLGYCEGNNVGIRAARGDFIMILNPDTIVHSECITELMSGYSKYGDGLYQPKILDNESHEIFISTGNFMNILGFGYSRAKGKKDLGQYDNDQEIGYASGTCLFTTAKILKQLGNFDPFLFAYHDDLDLGWRGKIQGIKSYYIFNAIIYHPFEGYSFKLNQFKMYLLERNRIYCIFKNFSVASIVKCLPLLLLIDIMVTLFYLKSGFFWIKIKANLNILRNIRHIHQSKKEIQKNRKLTDKEIIRIFTDDVEIPLWMKIYSKKMIYHKIIKITSEMMRKIIN